MKRIRTPLLSTLDTAILLGVCPRTLEKWRVTGEGPAFTRVGRRILYRPEAIEAYLNSQTFPSTTAADHGEAIDVKEVRHD